MPTLFAIGYERATQLIALLVWATRDTLRTGSVEKWGVRVKRATQPITFWALIITYVLWIALMAGCWRCG